jgi:hypothetical protein
MKGEGGRIMKKISVLVLSLLVISTGAWAADFVNGGFENGNLTGWTGGGGYWSDPSTYPAPVSPSQYVGGTPNNTIMSGGTDPITGANTVYSGSYSVRVNDSYNNYSVSTISQSVNNYTNNNIYFAWNAVLQSSHGLTDSDYFSLTLRDNTKGINIVSRAYSSAGSIGSGTSGVTWSPYSDWFSSGWVVENIDLLALGAVGDDFTLTLLASDCPYGGHAGYTYLDGFGAVTPPVGTPEPTTMLLLGLGLVGIAGFRKRS